MVTKECCADPGAEPATRLERTSAAPAVSAGISKTVIRPPHGWQFLNVAALWHHLELLFFLTWRDAKVRHKVLGAARADQWPAMM
jgi:hypothetical protein